MKGKCCWASKLAWLLVVIGALNWGLVGVFEWNLVTALFGSVAWLERLVYVLVGLGGLMLLASMKGCCGGKCKAAKGGAAPSGGAPSA